MRPCQFATLGGPEGFDSSLPQRQTAIEFARTNAKRYQIGRAMVSVVRRGAVDFVDAGVPRGRDLLEPGLEGSSRVAVGVGVGDSPTAARCRSACGLRSRSPGWVYARQSWREKPSAASVARAGLARPAWSFTTSARCTSRSMLVTGSGEPGFSKDRRLEPQITTGLLTDPAASLFMVSAFEGNKAETPRSSLSSRPSRPRAS